MSASENSLREIVPSPSASYLSSSFQKVEALHPKASATVRPSASVSWPSPSASIRAKRRSLSASSGEAVVRVVVIFVLESEKRKAMVTRNARWGRVAGSR